MTTSVALLEVNAANVQKAYIAYYGRPADPAGLNFWTTAGTSSTTMLTIMRDFGASAEFAALYGSGTNAAFVNAIYRNVFGRDADAGGLNFYVNALTNGSITRADVVFNVLNGATGADATIVANKVDFATQYTTALSSNVSAYVNYDATFGIPQARTALSGVTADSTAAQITASVNTSVTTVAAGATPPVTTGNTYTFTTNIETFSGTAFGDTFDGRVAASNGTFQDGDAAFGGAGSDTINLTLQGGSVGGTLNSVETANLRMVSSTTVDVINWSGTTSINVTNDSVDDKTLTVSNASQATVFTVADKASVVVSYLDTTGTGDVAKVVFNGAGTGSFSTNGTEVFNLGVSGTNSLTVSGDAVTSVLVSGAGSLTLSVNNNVSAINLTGFEGSGTVAYSATSNLAFTGGSGNDRLTISTQTLTSADTLTGGAGDDTLVANIDTAGALDRVSSFETGIFSISADSVATRVSGFSTLTFSGGAANTDVTLSGLAGGEDVNLALASADDITLNFSGGAATIDVVSVTALSIDDLTVSGATSLDLSIEGASSNAVTIDTVRASGASSVVLHGGVSGSTTINSVLARQAATVTATASGNASLTISAFTGYAFTSFNAEAQGSASVVDLAGLTVSGQTTTVALTASGTRNRVELDGVSGAAAALTIDINVVGSGAQVGSATDMALTVEDGSISVDVDAARETNARVGNIEAGDSGSVGLNLVGGASAGLSLGNVSAGTITGVTLNVGAEGSGDIGNLLAIGASGTVGTITLIGGASGLIDVGNVSGAKSVGQISVNAGDSADVVIGNVGSMSGFAGISGSIGASADFTIGSIEATSARVGAVDFVVGAAGSAGFGTVTGSGVASITIALGANASGSVDDINAKGASVGALSVSGGDAAGLIFGGVSGSGVGLISAVLGSAGNFTVGNINGASAAVAGVSVDIGAAASAGFGTINGSGVGNVSLTLGQGASGTVGNITGTSASIGTITVTTTGSAAGVTIGDLSASGSIGVITATLGRDSQFTIGSSDVVSLGTAKDFLSTHGGFAVSGGDNTDITIGAVSAEDAVGTISIAVGSAGSFQISAVESFSAGIGAVSFTVGSAAVGSAEAFSATNSTIGDITISGSGTVTIADIVASGVGNITVAAGINAATITDLSATTVGALDLDGDGVSITIDANVVGDVDIGGSAVTLNINGSARVGDIEVTGGGSGTTTIDLGNATGVGTITATGTNPSGTLVIDLGDVAKSGIEVNLGAGTNRVTVSDNGDRINLRAGTGTDRITFTDAGSDGVVITGLQFSGADSLSFLGAGFSFGLNSASAAGNSAGALQMVTISGAATATIYVGNTASNAATAATDVLMMQTGSFDNISDVFAYLSARVAAGTLNFSATQGTLGANDTFSSTSDLLVVWYDEDDQVTRLTLVNATASTAGNFFTLLNSGNVVNLAEIDGLNVDIHTVSSTTFIGG